MENSKTCSKCAASKPVSEFFFKDVAKTKYRSWCKPCEKAGIQNRVVTPEKAEALKVKERARNLERRDYNTEWRTVNKDRLKESARIRQANKPKPLPKPKQVPTSSDVFFVRCQQTGTLFTAKGHGAKYCAEGRRLVGLISHKRYEAVLHDKKQLTCTCKQCRQTFMPEYGNGKRVYCSDACSRASEAAAKLDANCNNITRARFYGVAYEPVKVSVVMGRADWHCQSCGIATPRAKRGGYDDDAPEVDHIIPLCKGGTHLYSNVQCLCRRCNLDKANTIPNKQYRGGNIYP